MNATEKKKEKKSRNLKCKADGILHYKIIISWW